MGIHRVKHTFTAGELSPLMDARMDFDRYKNGCKKLHNMLCATQGPAIRRPGFRYIYDLVSLGMDTVEPKVRMIPFIFNELQAYAMIFFKHTDTTIRMVLGTQNGLVVYPPVPTAECPPGTPVTPTPGDVVVVTMTTGWDIDNFDWAQSADFMYIAQSGLAPCVIKRYAHDCWDVEAITFTAPPSDWGDPPDNGWPEKVTLHQQRLVFAANLIRPHTVWMSQAGSFHDFTVDTGNLTDDMAITFTLDSGTQNRIQWVLSAKALNVGTLGNEWTITGSTQFALTPSNILAQRQTNNGSEGNKPLMIGITTLFVERHGRTVNEFVYDYTFDSYKTSDMAILSTHLTEAYSIVDWTYQQTPDSIIWCVRGDGDLLGITYQRHHKVIGWHHHDTDGGFKAVTCIPGDTREDDVWTVVHRVVDGSDHFFVEKMADQFLFEEPEYGRFVDSHVVYLGVPVSTMSGLDHLEGKTVHVLADGTVHPTCVVSGGEIELNNEYVHIVAGLQFISEVRPYVPDIPTRMGSTMGRTQRVTTLDIDFYRSLGVFIGTENSEDGEREEEAAFRVPGDLMGVAVPLFTGIYSYDFPEGFDNRTDYFIRQKQPLPLVVRGVVDTVDVME